MSHSILPKIKHVLDEFREEIIEAQNAEHPTTGQQHLRQVHHNLETALAAAEMATDPPAPKPVPARR